MITSMALAGRISPKTSPCARPISSQRCLEIILDALAQLGARPEDVVRTRVFVTSGDDAWAYAPVGGGAPSGMIAAVPET